MSLTRRCCTWITRVPASSLVIAGAMVLGACDVASSRDLGDVVSIECTSESVGVEPDGLHWQLRIAKGGAAELREYRDGHPSLLVSQVAAAEFEALIRMLEDMRFAELASGYEPSLQSSDPSWETVVVTSSAAAKSVTSLNRAGPAELVALLQRLGGIVQDSPWSASH